MSASNSMGDPARHSAITETIPELDDIPHRVAEGITEKLKFHQSLIRLCVDTLALHSVLGLEHVKEVLETVSDETYQEAGKAETLTKWLHTEFIAAKQRSTCSETKHQQAANIGANALQTMLKDMQARYADNQAIDDLFVQAVALAGRVSYNTSGGEQQ